jgi:hypothetical protein
MGLVPRALAVWCAILALAFVNGATRELWLIPRMGPVGGQIISAVGLCLVILVAAWAAADWMALSAVNALAIGVLWLALTVTFEFGAGHYLFGRPWPALIGDYKGVGAFIRGPMLVTTLLAPLLAAWSRGRLRTPA